MNIIFYNNFHNGDIYLSRSLVKKVAEFGKQFGHHFFYSHKNNSEILKDISHVATYLPGVVNNCPIEPPSFIKDGELYFNTWYGSDNFKFMNEYGLSFDCLYELFNTTCQKELNFKLSDISNNPIDFFPEIDYTGFSSLNKIDEWCNSHSGPKVFISNGNVLSGQANNFSFADVINKLSTNYPNILFIATNYDPLINTKLKNVFFSSNIIEKKGFDLNENAYLSTKCNLIVGRSSGTFTFASSKKNLFDIGQTFITFSNLQYPKHYWLSYKFDSILQYKSKVINQPIWDVNKIYTMIVENLP